jgi:hypothetical protein
VSGIGFGGFKKLLICPSALCVCVCGVCGMCDVCAAECCKTSEPESMESASANSPSFCEELSRS